ncbi:MAG: hypothetical protein M1582_00630, partial [Actinobacteria bacterium]|nr:hypothetical protein [Actinomycetota bacterium]
MADNVFGDPNRQYGIPGIDNQVPGSAAQAAGVSAYRQTYKSSGDTGAATQAAVNAAAQSIQNNPANIPAGGMTAAQQLTVAEAKAGTTQPTSAGVSPSLIQAAWIEGLLGNNGTQSAAPVTTTAPASSAKTIVASDGQTLAGQDAATQSMFEAAYGAMAAQQWASQHNSALLGQGAAGSSTNITLPG